MEKLLVYDYEKKKLVKEKIYKKNYRHCCLIYTKNFGQVIQVDIGALTIGSIKQNLIKGGKCKRGEEKGYFEIGGSTIILIFKKNSIIIENDILQYSEKGIESYVKYGSAIGRKYGI